MDRIIKCVFATCLTIIACHSSAQSESSGPPLPYYLLPDYSDVGRPLPSGVPRDVDTNGNVIYVPLRFTTRLYQQCALELVSREANSVAEELNLTNDIPITISNLVEFHISPFGFAYARRAIGFIATSNYTYYVSRGDKFSDVTVADYDQTCSRYMKQSLPIKQFDTNAAYQLATQWLSAVHMDVKGLNRDYRVHIALSPFWNGLSTLGEMPRKQFVPIYYVWWTNDRGGRGGVADVELFEPTKTLLQLDVQDPKYILRQPLAFTNLAALFPGVATISTNYPVKTIPGPVPSP
ncbi:MAG: hypothetical protein KGJ88_11595 [Verrucomicrobiota bacterium]|nr:hypothetical protein [Verrucomicrobiota bacterium]